MLAVITGIPGSGKTTLTREAIKILEKKGISYKLLNYGDVMFQIARREKLVKKRDEMRKLNPKKQTEIQILAAKKISEKAKKENIILDTHCTISTKKGYIPGLPLDILKELELSLLILIESKEKEIGERRFKDKSRERDEEKEKEIKLHQELNRAMAMAYSSFTKAPVKIIQNPQGKIKETSEELAKILKF